MSTRRSIPGGLRTQLLVGLALILAGTFALVLITVENVLARQLRESALAETENVADVIARASASGTPTAALLQGPVVAIGSLADDACVGRACSLLADAPQTPRLVRDGDRLVGIAQTEQLTVAVEFPDLEEQQRRARGFLWPFFLIDAIFVLALGYGFFTFLVMRPLRAIGVATTRVSQGDFASPISLLPRNEFGTVGRSFNRMLEQIDDGRHRLESKIEEVEAANARLASTQASLVRSEKLASVGHLSAGIAHEVGNPLAAISGYVEILGDDELSDGERSEILERVAVQVARIRQTIRNLLDYSRSDERIDPEPVDLADVAHDAISLVEALPKSRNVTVTVEGEARAMGVRNQLVQVLVNLLVNAVDALDGAEGTITIELETREDDVTMRVIDDGPGIAPEQIERIFDPFFTTKEVGEGTGLGLSLCQRMIEDQGGTLDVTSVVGEGTTFNVTLRGTR